MKNKPDIESNGFITGLTPHAKIHINVNEESRDERRRSGTSRNSDPAAKKRKLIVLHVLFFLISCIFSAGAGYAAFVGQRNPQTKLFQTQFDSTVVLLGNSIQSGFNQKFSAARLLQKLYQFAAQKGYGDTYLQTPPFFTLPGFEDIFTELATLGGTLRGIGWYPLVDTTNTSTRPAWEAWAKKNLLPQTAGLTGPDIQSAFSTMNATAYKYGIYNRTNVGKQRDGNVILGGDPRFAHWIFPAWQVAPLATSATAVFLDGHSFVGTRMQTIEKILAGKEVHSGSAGIGGAFTNIVQLSTDAAFRPSTNFYAPVYSMSPTPTLFGLVDIILSWDLLISNALPNNLKRIDCVVTTKTTMFTLTVDQGTVSIDGKGDFHESSMTAYGQNIVIDLIQQSPLSASDFTITVYPSSSFFNQYNTSQPSQLGILLAVAVFVFFSVIHVSLTYYVQQREKIREENERGEKVQEEAHRAQEDAKKAERDREREHRLRQELQENIANSAHDIKSPTTALGLAVESLLDVLDSDKPLTEATRHRVVETLHGMVHTISALTMIINRTVDASSGRTGTPRAIVPNRVPVNLEQIMDEVMAFSQWQADGTGIDVVMEPLPAGLPEEVMMDEKWLKDDLLCAAGNCVKYSRLQQGMPVLIRVAIVSSPAHDMLHLPCLSSSVQFSFIDSGYPLLEERLTTLFQRPEHGERTQTGGMGLGLFCLSKHVEALQGRYGARRRTDGREGTEIWFSFPLIDVSDIEEDQFVLHDELGNGPNLSLRLPLSRSPTEVSSKTANNTTLLTVIKSGKSLFSAPQNRRSSIVSSSFMKFSQRSHNSQHSVSLSISASRHGPGQSVTTSSKASPRDSSLRSVRGGDGSGGGMDGHGHVTRSVVLLDEPATEADVTVGTDVIAGGGGGDIGGDVDVVGVGVVVSIGIGIAEDPHPLGTIASKRSIRKAILASRKSADRMQMVLGMSPILLVDDAVSILKMTKRAIQNECINVRLMEAKNGEEAYELVVKEFANFELIVTDIQMPVCDGFEFTRRVRQLERGQGLIPKMIIGISANDQQKIAEEAKESGMDGFMHKPFKLATLMDVIEDISNRRKQVVQQHVLLIL